MAQQGKIEISLWYSLAKWHRTVDSVIYFLAVHVQSVLFLVTQLDDFLRYAYIYIYRWDLAATSLADILDLDATSVKKTHSHSPPLSFKNKSKTTLLNPCPKPLTFPQGYLFFLDFYMVSNGTRDLKQAETTTNKFAMPKGGKVAKS